MEGWNWEGLVGGVWFGMCYWGKEGRFGAGWKGEIVGENGLVVFVGLFGWKCRLRDVLSKVKKMCVKNGPKMHFGVIFLNIVAIESMLKGQIHTSHLHRMYRVYYADDKGGSVRLNLKQIDFDDKKKKKKKKKKK